MFNNKSVRETLIFLIKIVYDTFQLTVKIQSSYYDCNNKFDIFKCLLGTY